MIIYGWRTRVSKKAQLPGVGCRHCGTANVHAVNLFRYFHIYWIPLFPYSRTLGTECQQCKAYADKSTFAESLTGSELLQTVKTGAPPIWMFSGLLAVCLLGGFAYADNMKKTNLTKSYIESPAAGDLLIVKLAKPIEQDGQKLRFRIYKLSLLDSEKAEIDISQWAYPTYEGAEKAINLKQAAIREFDQDLHMSLPKAKLSSKDAIGGTIEYVARDEVTS